MGNSGREVGLASLQGPVPLSLGFMIADLHSIGAVRPKVLEHVCLTV